MAGSANPGPRGRIPKVGHSEISFFLFPGHCTPSFALEPCPVKVNPFSVSTMTGHTTYAFFGIESLVDLDVWISDINAMAAEAGLFRSSVFHSQQETHALGALRT
jgi:hypothetical protein